jgi:adenosylcobinamide-phosphate synthase
VSRPRAGALALAVVLDLAAGEPPARAHPVAGLGRALAALERRARSRGIAAGGAAVLAVTAGAWALAALGAAGARRLGWLGLTLEAALLKPAFAVRALAEAATGVAAALDAGDLHGARASLGRDLVSRPVARLSPGEVASAAIESVAENLVDSVAAPLLAYAVGGLPAAWAYRAVNTADAMWGYRTPRYERFGKMAARLDDLVNLGPARIAAAALVAGAALAGEDAAGAARVAWRHGGRPASPNAGWPMAAMGGALGVTLTKPGAYRLGVGALPSSAGIRRALGVFRVASALVVGIAAAAAAWRGRRP